MRSQSALDAVRERMVADVEVGCYLSGGIDSCAVLGLAPVTGGSIRFKGRDLTHMSEEELRHLRGSEIAMIYQEPMASLNPAMKIGAQLAEVPLSCYIQVAANVVVTLAAKSMSMEVF